MKSIAFGTAGLVLALSGSLMASAPTPANVSPMQTVPVVSLPPSKPLVNSADNSFGSNDSFLVVDKGELDLTDSSMNNRGANQNADHKSVESSGNPADSSGVPMPRAGWISFFGLLFVIAARQFSHSRRHRTAMS
jgi:hypothetical protein